MNQGIFLEKGKTAVSMINMGSMLETLRGISVLCMIIALLLGCGDPNLGDLEVREKIWAEAIHEDSLQNRRGPSGEELRYAPNQERPYNGWVKSSSQLYQFQNGKRHGTYISWYSNQQNSARGTFLNGQRNGLWTEWYENGQKRNEGSYKEGWKEGMWSEWSMNGRIHSKGFYKQGEKEDAWIAQYENGQRQSEGVYTNGKKGGSWIEWHENGQKQSEGVYTNGKKGGSWIEWHENGQKQSEGVYLEDGKDGLWFSWYKDGNIHRVSFEGEKYNNFRLELSLDWQTIASVDPDDFDISIWDAETGQLLKQLNGHKHPVNKVMFSSDGKLLLSDSRVRVPYSNKGSYRLWNVETGKILSIIPRKSVAHLGFGYVGYNGKTLAIPDYGPFYLLDGKTGQLLKTLNFEPGYNSTFSPDGKTAASVLSRELSLLNVNTGRGRVLARDRARRRIASVAFSPDGKTIASGYVFQRFSGEPRLRYKGGIGLWDVNTGKERAGLYSFQVEGIRAVAFSPNGKTIASGSEDGTVGLWNVETKKLQKTFHFPNRDSIDRVLFSPNGETLSAISGESIQCWKIW